MYYPSDFELGYIENESSLPKKGIKVLIYRKGEFIGGTVFDNSIPPSLLIDMLDMYAHTCEADKISVVLEDGRKVSKKFDK